MPSTFPAPVPGADQALRLLIAESDPGQLDGLVDGLSRKGAEVTVCGDGAEALLQIGLTRPDAVLVGPRLPLVSGTELLTVLRRRHPTYVIFGVGSDDAAEATQALSAGAQACVARPYRVSEVEPILLAARPSPPAADGGAADSLQVGPVRIDLLAYEVQVSGRTVRLALREFQLLHYLMLNPDRALSREQIRDVVWGGAGDTNTVVVHIRRLRAKLGDDPKDPELIRTIRGVGYRFSAPGRR
jgi:DNA-binding response OmpR family regulator